MLPEIMTREFHEMYIIMLCSEFSVEVKISICEISSTGDEKILSTEKLSSTPKNGRSEEKIILAANFYEMNFLRRSRLGISPDFHPNLDSLSLASNNRNYVSIGNFDVFFISTLL